LLCFVTAHEQLGERLGLDQSLFIALLMLQKQPSDKRKKDRVTLFKIGTKFVSKAKLQDVIGSFN
jgi:hypothetical protein